MNEFDGFFLDEYKSRYLRATSTILKDFNPTGNAVIIN